VKQGRLAGAGPPGYSPRLPRLEDQVEIAKDRAGLIGEPHRKGPQLDGAIICRDWHSTSVTGSRGEVNESEFWISDFEFRIFIHAPSGFAFSFAVTSLCGRDARTTTSHQG
jgi:hypothetical protein